MTDVLSPKDPEEIIIVGVDFTDVLGGETATLVAWECSVLTGAADAGAAAMLSGAPINADAPIFKHKVINGLDGRVYKLRVEVTTNAGRLLVGCAYLPVKVC